MTLLPIHVIAGAIGIASGAVALSAAKGEKLHRESGIIFVYAMLALSGSGAVMAGLGGNWATVLQAALTFYLVTTALLTIRRRVAGFHWTDVGALLAALTIGSAHLTFGVEAVQSATGTKYGYPPPLFFIFGSLALVAAIGDLRMMLKGGLPGRHRIARHLRRMCFATFIASASFFLGQAKLFPEPIRIVPVLAVLALMPLVLMFYWLARVTLTRRYARASIIP